jgi:DGQHR domain-containing protein
MADASLPPPLPVDEATITQTFPAIRIKQPIGDIYVCTMDHNVVQRITFFDVRRTLRDSRDIERYLGIQRPVNEKRIEDLTKYVNYRDATFPSSIILAVEEEYASYDEKRHQITLSNTKKGEKKPSVAFRNLCRVLDGQHRIAGLQGFTGTDFEMPVSLFIGSDISDQAYVFATVNLEQNKVNKSLAYDLYELAKSRSPVKTCHNIAVQLDLDDKSPFYHRIKRLGVTTEGRNAFQETIAQATFVEALLPYISTEPKLDRDLLLRGKPLTKPGVTEESRLCLRNLFIQEQDVKIGKIIEQYFIAVSNRWPKAWKGGGKGFILNRTNGFKALMKVFGKSYIFIANPGDYVPAARYATLFDLVKVSDDYFNVNNFKPGSSGESDLRKLLEDSMGLNNI